MEEIYKQGLICCGENCPDFNKITKENWISERNKFLRLVAHNGERSHLSILYVLTWFAKFLED